MKKTKKKVLFITLGLSLVLLTPIFICNSGIFNIVFGSYDSSWVHYSRRDPTKNRVGIREYWVRCGGGYQFNKPSSLNIKEATSYDTSGFTASDPRYIKYVDDSLSVFYNEKSPSYNYDEVSYLSGYTPNILPSSLGESTRVDFYKDDYSCMYSAYVTRVSGVISSNEDLKVLQGLLDTQHVDGYYVLSKDLTKPTSYVTKKPDANFATFTGTFDGRNHSISTPVFWGYRMFGSLDNATIKNLNFTNISVFSVLCHSMKDTILDNVNFYTTDSINQWSNVGMICDIIYGESVIKNSIVDYRQNFHTYPDGQHFTTPIAAYNYSTNGHTLFENVTIKCLSSTNLFIADGYGRSLRPTEGISYVSTFKFIDSGTLNYNIKYLSTSSAAQKAANLIKLGVESSTGKTISINSFTSQSVFSTDTPSIIVGSDASLTAAYGTLPSSEGEYTIRTLGKTIFINSFDDSSYQVAASEFLYDAFGYTYVSSSSSFNTVKDKSNIDLFCINKTITSPFKIRRCDWGDAGFMDPYSEGYTCTGYSGDDVFFDVPAVDPNDPYMSSAQRFHTSLFLIYPDAFKTSHPKWFATNSYNNFYDKYNNSYITWQLCYTAHGDENEYNALVNEMAAKVVANYNNSSKKAHIFCLGIGDSYQCCKCSTCKAKSEEYGSIAGTLIKFTNDVNAKVRLSLTKDELQIFTFAYTAYQTAPFKNGKPTITSDVPIMLAPIEANFVYPINDKEHNSDVYEMFENWSQIAPLYSWLYETNFSNFLYPYNSFYGMTESIKYMATKGVQLAYVQGQHVLRYQYRTGFNQLKEFLGAKFMMNPNSNYNSLVDAYFNAQYGSGSSIMRTFYNQLVERMYTFETNSTLNGIMTNNGKLKSLYCNIYQPALWDKTQLETWINYCKQAYNLESSTELKKNILAESLFPRFCLCTQFDSKYSSSDLLTMRKEFKTIADSLKATYTSEGNQKPLSSYYSDWGIA